MKCAKHDCCLVDEPGIPSALYCPMCRAEAKTVMFKGMLWNLAMLDREIVKYRRYKAEAMLDRRMPLEGYAKHLDGLVMARHKLLQEE